MPGQNTNMAEPPQNVPLGTINPAIITPPNIVTIDQLRQLTSPPNTTAWLVLQLSGKTYKISLVMLQNYIFPTAFLRLSNPANYFFLLNNGGFLKLSE